MLTWVEKLLFLLLAIGALTVAYREFQRMGSVIRLGRGPDTISFAGLPKKLIAMTTALVTQGTIFRARTLVSFIHSAVAWGFIWYGLVNVVDLAEGYLPESWHIWTGDNIMAGSFRLLSDIFSVLVLVGVVLFLARRFLLKDEALTTRDNVLLHPKAAANGISRDSLIVGGFIVLHVGARFLGSAALAAKHGGDSWTPIADLVGSSLLGGLSEGALSVLWHLCWWLALGSILLFTAYFPRTKHAHLFMAPVNFATRPDRPFLGAMQPLDFDDEEVEQFGASTLADLSQTQIVDAFACIMCNRCQEVCPAYTTGKELSPAALEINKRYHITETYFASGASADNGTPAGGLLQSLAREKAAAVADEAALIDYALTPSALWACTSCGACSDVCPVGNEPMMDILDMRRAQVLMEDEYPAPLAKAFSGIEQRGNPWGSSDDRMAWTEPLSFEVPTVTANPDFEYLLWIGCAGSFDPDAQKVARAVATILHVAGSSYAVLGKEEACTGDPARRAGNEYLYHESATQAIETLNKHGVQHKKVIASCPHCLSTIGGEYSYLGGDYSVVHHSELITSLLADGSIRLDADGNAEPVTYHDPCFLGRHNGIYDDPRQALTAAGVVISEMADNKEKAMCCGGGGSQVWKEEEPGAVAVSLTRYRQAEETGASTVAVGCPFCSVMLKDAGGKVEGSVDVKDIAEIVVERLVDKPVEVR